MGELLQLRDAAHGVSSRGSVRGEKRPRLSEASSQGATPTRHPAIPGRAHLRTTWRPTAADIARRRVRVSLRAIPVGEPDAGKPHVRFDERGAETEPWAG